MTTPAPQRQPVRRSDRYRQESGVAPSTELMQQTAPTAAPRPVVTPQTASRLPQEADTERRPRRTQAAAVQRQISAAPSAPPAHPAAPKPPVQTSTQPIFPVAAPQKTVSTPVSAPAARPKLPKWLFISLIACFFVILSLFTAASLMNAYIVQQEQAREAAYARVLDNHPMQYQELIERYAAENNLNPAFVAAIILNESSFRTNAESSVGARGLMQLMSDTAGWIAGKLDAHDYTFDDMYTAEQNIRFGTWYLSYLAKMFRGDAILVSAAYHAGQGEITGWLSDPAMSDDGLTIPLDRMMDGPTKTYVRRVTQAYAIYQAIYYPEAADGAAGSAAVPVFAGG